MVYIFTALYHEAHSLISHYNLKKDTANPRFQAFCSEDDEIRLTVTGVGEIAAAAAVASICTGRQPEHGDFMVNIGICAAGADGNVRAAGNAGTDGNAWAAGNAGVDGNAGNAGGSPENRNLCGRIFLCNQLIEQETGRTFYPDMLYRHDFAEGCVITGRNLWTRRSGAKESACGMQARNLYDMEAAAIYQAGAYFFAPHRMSFVKIVSDNGDTDGVSPERIECLMEENREKIVSYIETLRRVGEEEQELKDSMTLFQDKQGAAENKPGGLERLCADLHCSSVMCASVQQYFRYLALSGMDYDRIIKQMYEDGRLPCRDKREGKVRFEELKRELL